MKRPCEFWKKVTGAFSRSNWMPMSSERRSPLPSRSSKRTWARSGGNAARQAAVPLGGTAAPSRQRRLPPPSRRGQKTSKKPSRIGARAGPGFRDGEPAGTASLDSWLPETMPCAAYGDAGRPSTKSRQPAPKSTPDPQGVSPFVNQQLTNMGYNADLLSV